MDVSAFLAKHWITIAFYSAVILLLIINRKKFEFQGKFIALRRTKIGIPWMERFSKKHAETIKIFGYTGIGIGFAGMVFIFGYVVKAFVELFTNPAAPAAFSLVLPGVNIPGSPIYIPLWVIGALFIVVLLHEGGHGIVAKAHGVKIKNTGIVFFGPLVGAFVDPDEKQIEKSSDVVKYSIFAAGPFANFLTAIVALLLIVVLFNPLTNTMVDPVGFSFTDVQDGLPADIAGIIPGVTYNIINGQNVTSADELLVSLSSLHPNDTIEIANSSDSLTVILGSHPEDSTRGYLGVLGVNTETEVQDNIPYWFYVLFRWVAEFIMWIFILSIGLGAFNLLPLGPVDGGQMIRLALEKTKGVKKGRLIWGRLAMILFVMILFLVFLPIIRTVFF